MRSGGALARARGRREIARKAPASRSGQLLEPTATPCHPAPMPSPRHLAFAKALSLADIKPQCPSCGAPEKFPVTVVVLNDDEELGPCEACGGWLDPTGRPVGDGDSLQVIRLTEKPAYWQAQARA